jgi:hypothetical protein
VPAPRKQRFTIDPKNQRHFLINAGVDRVAIPVVLRSAAQNCATLWTDRFAGTLPNDVNINSAREEELFAGSRELDVENPGASLLNA